MKVLSILLSMLCTSCAVDGAATQWREAPYPALNTHEVCREDPIEGLRQHPDYVEQRVRAVGLGTWGGPLRLDLELDWETRTPLRSIYMDRGAFLVGDDPFVGRTCGGGIRSLPAPIRAGSP